MPEAMLKTSLAGKIRNLKNFKSEALLPLFEAVVNSIQAIEDRGNCHNGEITVRIIRETAQGNLKLDGDSLPPITGFEIEDNGVGFNDANFDSFNTAESTYKLDKGGKGIGRFLWLKAFDRAEIHSVFVRPEGSYAQRVIDFTVDEGVQERSCTDVPEQKPRTTVSLIGFHEDYRKQTSAYRTCGKIAQRILEHCLARFISGSAPRISVVDSEEDETICISDLYKSVEEGITTESFAIGGHNFTIHHIRLYSTRSATHQLVYCAHGRNVKERSIAKLLGTTMQFDESGKKFFYSAYLTSPFLDERVDEYRQEFNIPEAKGLIDDDDVAMDTIETESVGRAREHLAEVITSIEEQKVNRVARHVENESPMLRSVIKYCPEAMKDIELNTSDERMVQTLYSYKGKAEYALRQKGLKLLKTQTASVEEVITQYQAIADQLEDCQKDQLAGYVVFRKMIIDLLEKKLELNTDGHYSNECIVHDIVFPRKHDSSSLDSKDHNLWLIDEQLSFHVYAASDKMLTEYTESESEERPDIAVFSEVSDDKRARAVSLLEFKKPQKTKFDEDPTKQLFRYVRQIREKGLKLPNGRPVTVDATTRFYCYAICDVTKQVREFAENGNYAVLQGECGFYNYNRNHNAHVEILAFDKVVLDAKQRHKAFFNVLGIKT